MCMCNTLQHTALQHTVTLCNTYIVCAVCCSVLQCVQEGTSRLLQCVREGISRRVCCTVLQCIAIMSPRFCRGEHLDDISCVHVREDACVCTCVFEREGQSRVHYLILRTATHCNTLHARYMYVTLHIRYMCVAVCCSVLQCSMLRYILHIVA